MSSTQPGAILPRVVPPGTFLLAEVLPRIPGRSNAAGGVSASGSSSPPSGRVGGACISGSSRLCKANTCTPFASASLDLARQQRALLVVGGVWGCASVSLGFLFFFFFCILPIPPEQSMRSWRAVRSCPCAGCESSLSRSPRERGAISTRLLLNHQGFISDLLQRVCID